MTVVEEAPAEHQAIGRPGGVGWWEMLAVVAVPTGLLGALFAYVGWARARAFYGYFGVTSGVVGVSEQGFTLGGAQIGFGAAARLAAAITVLVVFDVLLRWLLHWAATTRVQMLVRLLIAVAGLGCVIGGLAVAIDPAGAPGDPLLWAGLLALGTVLVVRWGLGLLPTSETRVRWLVVGLVSALLSIAGFWAATIYAERLGQASAQAIDADVSQLPLATVFSSKPLDIPGSDVIYDTIPFGTGPDGGTRYRYDGLSLLAYGNDRWFLITGRRSSGYRSSVLILRDSEDLYVQTAAPAGTAQARTE